MKLFGQYLKERKKVFYIALIFAVIFFAAFFLYRLPMKAVGYPTMLCLGIGLCILVYDFLKVRKKQELFLELQRAAESLLDLLPEPEGIEEEAYQKLIKQLYENQADIVTQQNCRYNDMIEYYTLWAHQIKTPIASMQLHLQNEDTALSRKLRSDLRRIEQYVEMVLTFLRLGSDSTDYVFKEYDMDTILRGSIKKFRSEFIERKLRLQYEPVNTTVLTDEKWLSFVIEQILSNALKYTKEGSITITMEKDATLCIRDTGIGIAPEDLPRIFENGYTGYNGRGDKKASGIGLHLCKRICQKLGHTLSADSVIGEGTVIRIHMEKKTLNVE